MSDPKQNPIIQVPWQPTNLYLPSAPSMLSEIADTLGELIEGMRETNFKQFFDHVSRLITSINKTSDRKWETL